MSDLPKEIRESVMVLGDLKIRVCHLDNGDRVVDSDDFEKFLGELSKEKS